jgi:hypothetical protein
MHVFAGLGHSDLVAAGDDYARVIKEWVANDVSPLRTSGSGEPKFG